MADDAVAEIDRPPQSRVSTSISGCAARMIASLPSGATKRGRSRRQMRLEAAQIEMVVMVVRDQHRVDPRQIREGDARRVHALRSGERERTGAVGKDRIDQDVAVRPPGSRMRRGRSERHAQVRRPSAGGLSANGLGKLSGQCLPPAAELPAQQLHQSLVLGLVRQMKAQRRRNGRWPAQRNRDCAPAPHSSSRRRRRRRAGNPRILRRLRRIMSTFLPFTARSVAIMEAGRKRAMSTGTVAALWPVPLRDFFLLRSEQHPLLRQAAVNAALSVSDGSCHPKLLYRSEFHERPSRQHSPARTEDSVGLSRVFDAAWREAYQGIIPGLALEKMIARRCPTWWRAAINRGRPLVVLDVGQGIAGYVSYGRCRNRGLQVDRRIGRLGNILTLPANPSRAP